MSDAVLNEEIARLEIEIDAVRDALDEAIKRNETLEAERDAAYADLLITVADLKTAQAALQTISDNGGDTLTIDDAVRLAEAALARLEQNT
jgi:hypothetical protein